jgi:hypothetical protein
LVEEEEEEEESKSISENLRVYFKAKNTWDPPAGLFVGSSLHPSLPLCSVQTAVGRGGHCGIRGVHPSRMLLLNDTRSNSTCAIMARDGAHALVLGRVGSTVFFFIGEFSPNPHLKNVISTNIKDFSWKIGPNFAKFRKRKKNSNRQISTLSSSR